LAFGLIAAVAPTRLMAGLLFGVKPSDPLTLGLAAALLACVVLAACDFPQSRPGHIAVIARPIEDELEITIEDNGPGLDPAYGVKEGVGITNTKALSRGASICTN
jgi:hypothetical protein